MPRRGLKNWFCYGAPGDIWFFIRFWFYAIVLRLFYWTRIRQVWNKLCQWKFDGKERAPMPIFSEPTDVWQYLRKKFEYRKDPGKGMLDYFSDPEIFHWRFLREDIPDGDCDDVARFAAACIQPMDGVQEVYVLHSGFNGGAHATVVFKRHDQWFHFDYGIHPILSPMHAPRKVAARYNKWGCRSYDVTYWNFETFDMRPVAISPTVLE